MKKILLTFLSFLSLLSTQVVKSQTFTVPHDTVIVPAFSTFATPHDDITNITSSNITMKWHVVASDWPADWLAGAAFGICDNVLCRNNFSNVLWNAGTSTGTTYTSTYGAKPTHDSTGAFDLTLDFTGTTTGGTHYLTINLSDFGSGYSKNITFLVTRTPVSVPSVSNTTVNDIVLYPNPAVNELNVVYNENADIKNIAIYNIIGKVMSIYKVNGASANLSLENIPSGIYFVRLLNSHGDPVVTRKFTKQ
jgi:Secretion system C-terminal sorting domain